MSVTVLAVSVRKHRHTLIFKRGRFCKEMLGIPRSGTNRAAESELEKKKQEREYTGLCCKLLGWATIMVVRMAGKKTVVLVADMSYGLPINKASCVIGVFITLNVNHLSHWNIIIVQSNPRPHCCIYSILTSVLKFRSGTNRVLQFLILHEELFPLHYYCGIGDLQLIFSRPNNRMDGPEVLNVTTSLTLLSNVRCVG
jgi:hypothetical protein